MKAESIEIVIPTYRRGEDNPYPPLSFGEKTRYKPYPYYLQDDIDIGDLKYVPDKKYRAVILANDILEAVILPEMNGRVYSLRNLKSGREIFYRNNVVKPALAALRGAWISGGIEFNAPTLGHSVSAVSPVFRHIESNEDEAAVLVGDVDRSTGIRWQVRISLKKGRAALDIETQISNPNKYRERLYYWENAAVPVGDDLRFMCDSDWTTGTFIMPWPLQDGVDRSWYLNNNLPVDHFCYRTYADFFGAHYSEKQCGTYHIGLRHETAGQKYFSWGLCEDNRIWESYLTDSDGQYVELQSGVLESQFVTGWLDAGKEVCFSGSWFGVENIGELTWANKHVAAALNIDGDDVTIDMASLDLNGEFLIRIMSKGNEILDKKIELTPGENSKIAFKGADEFEILLYSKTNRLLFQEAWRRPGETISKPETAPHNWSIDSASSPEWNKIEELEKYHCWNSALREAERLGKKMPPGEKDVALAEIFLKTGQPEAALRHLDRAFGFLPGKSGLHLSAAAAALRMFRETNNPKFLWRINDHCQASRNSGSLGKTALLILVETALLQGRLIEARNILESLLKHNSECPETLALLAGIARKCGDAPTAEYAISKIPDLWPQKAGESFLLHRKSAVLKNILPDYENAVDISEAVIEWLMLYRRVGWLDDLELLLGAVAREYPSCLEHPVALLLLSDCALRKGLYCEAEALAEKAENCSMKYVFPYRPEDFILLKMGIELINGDAPSLKYLSGLWLVQNGRPNEGLKYLRYALEHTSKEEIKILSSQSISQHALLMNDIDEEIFFLEKAVRPEHFDRRLYLALDEALHKKQELGARNRLAKSIPEIISHRGDIAFRRARLLFDNGQPEKALVILVSHKFSQHEGQAYVRRLYVDCLLVNGFSLFAGGDLQEAAWNFAGIMEYPENLGSTSHYLGEHSRLARFMLGMIDDALGDREKAESRRRDILSKKETGTYNGAEFSERRKLFFDEFAALELSAKELPGFDFEHPEMPVGKDDLAKQENRISKSILDKLLNDKFAEAAGIAEKAVNDYPCSALLRKMFGLTAAMRKTKSVPEALALVADR